MQRAAGTYRKGLAEVLLCYILWGIFPVFWKQLSMLNSFYVLASRIVWSALFCFVIVLCWKYMAELKRILCDKKQMALLAGSSVMIAINWGAYIYAVNSGHIVDASLGYYLSPLLSIAMAFLLFREPMKKLQWVAIAIAVAGIALAVSGYGAVPYFAIIISISFSIYGTIKKMVSCTGVVSTLIEAMMLCPFALAFIAFSEYTHMGAVGVLSPLQWLLIPATGVVTSVPLLAFSNGISKVPLSVSGILMYINPTIQLLLGVVLYNEGMDASKWVMFVCIWVAIVLFLVSGNSLPKKREVSVQKSGIKNGTTRSTVTDTGCSEQNENQIQEGLL